MKKIIMIILALVLISCSIFTFRRGLNLYISAENNAKKNVGEKVIIGKDTLEVLDYSLLNENYTLSNGAKMSFDFFEKRKVKK